MNCETKIVNDKATEDPCLDELTSRLLARYQRGFPLDPRPFRIMAKELDCSESDLVAKLQALKNEDVVTRVGPVFEHSRAGASLLAAVSVPAERVEQVAEQINSYPEVNHNYGREHSYNLWFVVTAPSKTHLNQVLERMESEIGFLILRLPMKKPYHIDLGFHVGTDRTKGRRFSHSPVPSRQAPKILDVDDVRLQASLDTDNQQRLRAVIQDGLPITAKPFATLAKMLGIDDEYAVINTIRDWLDSGLIKRLGLVSNHHRLGFTQNAMVVWDVSEQKVDVIGERFKESGLVSLCYQRKRHLPHWPYNFYCMIHSRDRESVAQDIERLVKLGELESTPKAVLFSTRQYKQKGGLYTLAPEQDSASTKLVDARIEDLPHLMSCPLLERAGQPVNRMGAV
ncbi:hypothetical protein MIB92_14945 [Aestuariirhabdus sp. Z084]|uniref:siroheme decarboxylase subunit beta n=1 Tax=Aestuariirhabdus haliotis TaxID=2918751 RepID=UPI00201B3EE7|nr:hypothetical protein [Aestuariirhabdus haliotis]MCL6416956.1 hypothetical protein [Aestuariirhabdus haliotis]MCL6420941.1 hypothetical protein [Aestuariirhabdus haliotis]